MEYQQQQFYSNEKLEDFGLIGQDHSLITQDPDVPKKSTCEQIGKKTCTVIIAIAVIFLIMAICWWLFQICSSGNSNQDQDQDQGDSPFCEVLGDIGQLIGDAARVLTIAVNNLIWILAVGVLYGLYKLSGAEIFKSKEEEARDNIETTNTGYQDQEYQYDDNENDGPQQNEDDYGEYTFGD